MCSLRCRLGYFFLRLLSAIPPSVPNALHCIIAAIVVYYAPSLLNRHWRTRGGGGVVAFEANAFPHRGSEIGGNLQFYCHKTNNLKRITKK